MSTYSSWLAARRALFVTAMTNAYNNRANADTTNEFRLAWEAMSADSELSSLIAPNNVFYGGSPNGTDQQIETFRTWLQDNPVAASRMNLSAEVLNAFRNTGRKTLGGGGTVGSEKRKWKGQQLFTFPNGALIGRDNSIVAAIGSSGGNSIDGYGTDTLVYFDGVPFSRGTGTAGVGVFAGDLVVSGSIQGTGGIVVIDDVIQLETGQTNPAGIGVDKDGKIRLRHRGEGFLDLVDEVEKAKAAAIEDTKLWVGTQNTNSVRWGSSLIPNSNFSMIRNTGSVTTSNYAERPAGVISAGTTSEIATLSDGIATITQANGQGIVMQAIPIDCERYTIRIRYKGSAAQTPTQNNSAQGLWLGFHETTDTDSAINGKLYIYDNSTPGTNTSSNAEVHSANVTVKYPDGLLSTDNSTHDGAPISDSGYEIRSYVYEPSASAKNASLVIWARNYTGNILIDYVVLTENPKTTLEINNLISGATSDIESETGSEITDAQMTNKSKWAAIGGATLTDLPTGGDGNDEAIKVICASASDGITSEGTDCLSDAYITGLRIKVSGCPDGTHTEQSVCESAGHSWNASKTTNVYMSGIETAGPYFASLGDAPPKLVPGVSNYRTKTITLAEIDDSTGLAKTSPSPANSMAVSTSWKSLIGTYQPNKLHPTNYSTGYVTPTNGSAAAAILPGKFSLAIQSDSAATLVIDFVYAAIQSSSINLAQELANSAYGDSQTFITQINDLLIKESGSIITNASMALVGTGSGSYSAVNAPAGYSVRGTGATIATNTDGNGDKQVRITSSQSEGVNRILVSPPFTLGQADKFSIGVRCKSLEVGDVNISIAIAITDHQSLPSGKNTYGESGGSEVQQVLESNPSTAIVEHQLVIDNDSNTQGGDSSLEDKYDWAVGNSDYENVVGTFVRAGTGGVDTSYSKKSASVVITASGDFEVDYILVKEQVCSFSLAEETAEDKRDEAIAQASGALQGLTNGLNQEQGSLLANSSFGSYLYDSVLTKQVPKNWAWTRDTTSLHRVVSATEVTSYNGQTGPAVLGEVVDNRNQVGACGLVTTGGNVNGILSSYFMLPFVPSTESTFTVDSTDYSPVGKYTLSLKIKVSSANAVGIRLLAHESKSVPDLNQEFIMCDTTSVSAYANTTGLSATARASSIHSDYNSKTLKVNDTTGSTSLIKVINISQDDGQAGYSSSDEYIEFFPVDTADKGSGQSNQGDLDSTVENSEDWYSVAGTYTPSTGAKFVSFEIIIEDTNSGSGRANVYVDYISLVAQTMDADFASTLAQARTEDLMDNLETEPPQTGNLLENPFFTTNIKRTRSSKNYPKKWVPYGHSPRGSFDFLQFANTSLFRGAKILGKVGSTSYLGPGIISRAFRTIAPDYEITVRLKRNSSSDGNIAFQVAALEYDSDIDDDIEVIGPAGNMPTSVSSIVQDETRYKYLTDPTNSDNSISRTDGGSITTDNVSGTTYVDMEHDNYVTYKIQYIPTSTARYTSIRLRFANEDDAGASVAMMKCVVDTPYKIMDRHLSTLFGSGENLASLLATPTKVFTGPLGVTNINQIKNSNITLTKSGGEFTFNGDSLGTLSASDVNAKSSTYSPSLSEVTSALSISSTNDILNTGVNQAFIEGAMGAGWSKTATLNANVVTGTAALGYTPFHAGNKPTKSDVGLADVGNHSPTDLAALTEFTDSFNKYENTDAQTFLEGLNIATVANTGVFAKVNTNTGKTGFTPSLAQNAAASMNLSTFSNFGSAVQTGVDSASDYVTRFQTPARQETFGKNELTNGEFKEINSSKGTQWGRPAHFAITKGSGLLGPEDNGTSNYWNGHSSYSGAVAELNFEGDHQIGYTDADKDTIHLKSAAALISKGIPLEGGKKYRISIRAKMSSVATGVAHGVVTNGGSAIRGDENLVSNNYNDSAYDDFIGNGETGYNWDQDGTTNNTYKYILVGLYYLTSEPGSTVQYIATTANTTTDEGDSESADGQEYQKFGLGSTWTDHEATLTLPDDVVFGSFFIRRAIRGRGFKISSTYIVTAGWSNTKYPIIEKVSLQKSTGLSVSTFSTMFTGVSGITSTTISNNWNISDRFLKDNIVPIVDGLEIIKQLEPKQFTWKNLNSRKEIPDDDFDDNGELIDSKKVPNYGLIAQDVTEVLPELVVQNAYNQTEAFEDPETGIITSEVVPYMGLDYTQLIPVAIKAIQEQQEIIESQRKDIDDLKELVNKLIEDKGE